MILKMGEMVWMGRRPRCPGRQTMTWRLNFAIRDSAKIEPIEWFNSSNAIMPTTIKGSSSRGGARACRSIVVVFLGFLFLENIVHQSVFDRFLGTEEEIAVGVFGDLLDRFARMF